MLLKIDSNNSNTIINTDHIVSLQWLETNPSSTQNPQLTIILSQGERIRLVQEQAQEAWNYFKSKAESTERLAVGLGLGKAAPRPLS